MSEGEIDLDQAGGDSDEAVMSFIKQLLQFAMQDEGGESRDSSGISSLSVQRQAEKLNGRIYGQVYTEKKGETVIFLRGNLFNAEGQPVMTCMATSHINQTGESPETKPEN
jgi:hypothetical protein